MVFIVPFNKKQLPEHMAGKFLDLSHIYQRLLCRKDNLQVHCDSVQVLFFQCLESQAHAFKGGSCSHSEMCFCARFSNIIYILIKIEVI